MPNPTAIERDPMIPAEVGGGRSPDLPPAVRLLMLTHGKRVSQVVYAVAALGVADELAAQPRTVDELAASTGTQPDPLYRVLRVAAVIGLVTEHPDQVFSLGELGDGLRTDVGGSVRDMILLNGEDVSWRPYGEILHTVRSGEPAFAHIYGGDFFGHLRDHPEVAGVFDRAMTQMSLVTGRMLAAQADFGRFGVIADIGGGRGHFLVDVLSNASDATGVLFDQPDVVNGSYDVIAAAGITDRVTIVGGSFFADADIPRADAYLLKAVLHDWSDDDAVRILSAIRRAIGDRSTARVFIGEQMVAAPGVWDAAKLVDLDMMLRFGGRERTRAEYIALARKAGFTVVPSDDSAGWRLLECAPVR